MQWHDKKSSSKKLLGWRPFLVKGTFNYWQHRALCPPHNCSPLLVPSPATTLATQKLPQKTRPISLSPAFPTKQRMRSQASPTGAPRPDPHHPAPPPERAVETPVDRSMPTSARCRPSACPKDTPGAGKQRRGFNGRGNSWARLGAAGFQHFP